MAILRSKRTKCQESDPHLTSLIVEAEWKKVRQYVTTNTRIRIPCYSMNCDCHNKTYSPLMLMCMSNPPFKLISTLLKKNPNAVFEVDCDDKSALHLACEYGASPAVIRKVLTANKDAASKQDKNGMLPIHLACSSYTKNSDTWISKETVRGALMQIILDLLRVESTLIMKEDNNGMCPIEHALESNLSMEIVEILQDKQMSDRTNEIYDATINFCQ